MPTIHRFYLDQPVFITCVTYKRYPVFDQDESIDLFWEVVRKSQEIHPFTIIAYVLLPDHFHWIIETIKREDNFSKVMQSVKGNFSYIYKRKYSNNYQRIWQKGFWDHVIRDDDDFSSHLDYIHFNPVKHGYMDNPQKWKQSSLRKWIHDGYYDSGWGTCIPNVIDKLELE